PARHRRPQRSARGRVEPPRRSLPVTQALVMNASETPASTPQVFVSHGRSTRLLLVVVLVMSATAAPSAQANGAFETFGVSPRTKGTANAVTAFTSGPEAVHYNPAGLALSRTPEVRAA